MLTEILFYSLWIVLGVVLWAIVGILLIAALKWLAEETEVFTPIADVFEAIFKALRHICEAVGGILNRGRS